MSGATAPRGVVAVVRAESAESAEVIAIGLAEGGVPSIEITMTVPDAVTVIERLRGLPARLGAGTVLDADAVTACVEAGASFIVSPDTDEEVIARAVSLRVAAVPGVMTPTEARRAMRLGAGAVKVFPVSAVGGTAFARALLEPFPHLELVASGGIQAVEVVDYFNVGCTAVCLGKELVDQEAARRRDVGAIARHARRVMEIATGGLGR